MPVFPLATALAELPPIFQWYWFIVTFITGASVGSFLNVVALRQLADEEFVQTPSHCPKCGYTLKWFDNIPILSWLILGGKCRSCKGAIHWQYPLVEAVTALLFLATGWHFGISWIVLPVVAFLATMVLLSITDFKEHVIFTWHALWIIPVGLLLHALGIGNDLIALAWIPSWTMETATYFGPSFWSALFGVAGIFGVFEGLIYLSRLLIGQDGFGHGDTLILMAIASFLGWEGAAASLLLGGVLTGVISLPIMFIQWIKEKAWGLVWKLGTALLATTGLYGLSYLELTPKKHMVISLAVMVGTAILLFSFLKEKKQVGGFTKVPFGPGLIAAAIVLLFFGQTILTPVYKVFSGLLGSI
ncbi:MAG: prepilin peptidase [Vampirovibrionales bacterium]